jgi:hypothetical protein
MECERFFEPFFQAACRARIHIRQFAENLLQQLLGGAEVTLVVGLRQLTVPLRDIFHGKVTTHVPSFMKLTSLHQAAIATVLAQGTS